MDILTQGLLGGVLAQTVAKKEEKKLATVIGVVAGLLADADILIRSASDPLLNIEFHRHFSHSLLFIPVGAVISMMLLWPFLRKHISVARLYLFCFLGYSMSGLLDACTSYGTHLFWPFSDARVALNIISIVDPLFTMILLVALVLGLRMKLRKIAYGGLILCALYLGFGFFQLHRAQAMAQTLVEQRGHTVMQHVVKPTLGNLLLWRSVYVADNKIYIDAVRVALFGKNQVFEGESLMRFSVARDLPQLAKTSVLYNDIQRFDIFANGFVGYDPTQKNVLGDMRYSMLPMSAKPLWGIVMDLKQPQLHADYRFFRVNTRKVRKTFFSMVSGNCEKSDCE